MKIHETPLRLPPAPTLPDWGAPPRRWLPDAHTLTEGIVDAARAGEPKGLMSLLDRRGAPPEELVATPLSARAALLGAQRGHAFYHHELRVRIPLPEALGPEVPVWDGAGTLPEWRDGVLAEPKYFSFFQEGPLTAFNPNHRGKWRPHELLHGAQGFYWSPTMSPFEFYIGARLGELLPVVHWYAFDEILRPRCPEHSGATRETCPRCEALTQPYWAHDRGWLTAQQGEMHAHAEAGLAHLESEWMACLKERETGRCVANPRGYLDASRDGQGYVKSHWNRVTAFSFGAWVEHFLTPGVDYAPTLAGAFEQSARVASQLLSGEISLSQGDEARLRARRALQDLGYRLFLALEWGFEAGERAGDALFEACLPAIEGAGGACAALLASDADLTQVPKAVSALEDALILTAPHLPEGSAPGLLAFGWRWPDALTLTGLSPAVMADHALDQLTEGLRSALPETAENVPDLEEWASDLHRNAIFDEAATLGERAAAFLVASDAEAALANLAVLEATLAAPPRRDEEGDLFAVLPEDPQALMASGGRLRGHATLRRLTVGAVEAEMLLGLTEGGDIAAVIIDGEPRILPVDPAAAAILDHIEADAPLSAWLAEVDGGALMTLLEHRFLVFFPPSMG